MGNKECFLRPATKTFNLLKNNNMEEQNNLNTDSNTLPDTFQQPINNDNKDKNKASKKLYLFFALIATTIIVLSGIGLVLYQQAQNNLALEKNLTIPKKTTKTNDIVVDEDKNNTEKIETPKNNNTDINGIHDNTFLLTDGVSIYEADLNGAKTKIVDLPYSQPIEILNTFVSKDKNTFLWTHNEHPKNDMSPEPLDIISYIYKRDTNSLKKFNTLETKTNKRIIFPIQLSPDGKYLMAKKNEQWENTTCDG